MMEMALQLATIPGTLATQHLTKLLMKDFPEINQLQFFVHMQWENCLDLVIIAILEICLFVALLKTMAVRPAWLILIINHVLKLT